MVFSFGCALLRANDAGTLFTWTPTLFAVCAYCTQSPVVSDDECGGLSRWKVVSAILLTFIAGTVGGWLYVALGLGLLIAMCVMLWHGLMVGFGSLRSSRASPAATLPSGLTGSARSTSGVGM